MSAYHLYRRFLYHDNVHIMDLRKYLPILDSTCLKLMICFPRIYHDPYIVDHMNKRISQEEWAEILYQTWNPPAYIYFRMFHNIDQSVLDYRRLTPPHFYNSLARKIIRVYPGDPVDMYYNWLEVSYFHGNLDSMRCAYNECVKYYGRAPDLHSLGNWCYDEPKIAKQLCKWDASLSDEIFQKNCTEINTTFVIYMLSNNMVDLYAPTRGFNYNWEAVVFSGAIQYCIDNGYLIMDSHVGGYTYNLLKYIVEVGFSEELNIVVKNLHPDVAVDMYEALSKEQFSTPMYNTVQLQETLYRAAMIGKAMMYFTHFWVIIANWYNRYP